MYSSVGSFLKLQKVLSTNKQLFKQEKLNLRDGVSYFRVKVMDSKAGIPCGGLQPLSFLFL